MIVVSLCIAGSVFGVSYAPGAFDSKEKTFTNKTKRPVIGIVRTSEMTLHGPIYKELRTGVIQPGLYEVITYATPGTREIRFEPASDVDKQNREIIALYSFDPSNHKSENKSEYILQEFPDVKFGGAEITIIETPKVDATTPAAKQK